MRKFTMDDMTSYCQQYGFVFQGSQIYGGLANTWDYGPLGTRLKNNIKDAWRTFFIQGLADSYELDADILMNPAVWDASGHVASFSDPLVDCKGCKTRHRADQLIAGFDPTVHTDGMTEEQMTTYLKSHAIPCPRCKAADFTDIRKFNLMFETHRGAMRESGQPLYLRPENAQGEYVNFINVARAMRAKVPFGIGQIGKVFRNEITPGNFIFRTIEFEQMEYQQFCRPGTEAMWYDRFKELGLLFYESLGIPRSRLRFHDHEKLAHYAKAATDIEYAFPFGWGEINGTHSRGDYDLAAHQRVSGKSMMYFDEAANERYLPFVVESTYGVGRTFLALLFESLVEEALPGGEARLVLNIKPALAPVQVQILPLIKKKHTELAMMVYKTLRMERMTAYDDAGTIGKRYRRGDAIGIPFAVTVDDETVTHQTVTVRERDTMQQTSVSLDQLAGFLAQALK